MFQRVHFAPRKAPIKVFNDIAVNPSFALNVKELIYDGRLFLPELGDGASYKAAFCARMLEEFDTYEDYTRHPKGAAECNFAHQVYQDSIWNVERLGAGVIMKRRFADDCEEFRINVADSFERYENLLEWQERILKDGTDFKALCEGLKSIRNINKVDALACFDHCSDYYYRADNSENFDDWYSRRSKLEFGLTVPPSRWCRRPASQDGGELDRKERTKWDVRGVQALFRAVSTHCPGLKELCLGSFLYKAPLTIFELSDPDVEKVRIMARRIRTLRLHPYVTKSGEFTDYARQRYCLDILLQEAKELRMLSSSAWFLDEESEESEESDDGNEDPVWSDRISFGMFCGKVWPYLTKLCLETDGSARVKAGDLMSIIRAHKGSLRELSMWGIMLLGKQGWEYFGRQMGQILELHHIEVHGLYDDITLDPYCRFLQGDQGLAFVRDMMQWALPDLLEIEEKYGTITGRVKAGSS